SLLSISGRSIVRVTNGPPLSALEWLLDTMARPETADQLKVFRIQHPDLEGLLGADKAGLGYYSFNELTNQIDSIQSQAQKLVESERDKGEDADKLRTGFQRDLMHLYHSMVLYNRLKNSLQPEGSRNF